MFLCVTYAFITAEGSDPSIKNFGKSKEANLIDERVEFHMKLKQKKLPYYTYVIDLIKNECIKNSYRYDKDNPVDDAAAVQYFVTEYRAEILDQMKNLTS